MVFRILNWASRIFLAGIFFYSGYVKWQEPLQFAANLTAYQLLPQNLILPVVTYLPWFELALGAMLLIGWKIRWTAAVTAALLSMFIVAMVITYFRGIEADCGCFGSGDPISPLTMLRDASFLLPALFLLLEPQIRRRWSRPSA